MTGQTNSNDFEGRNNAFHGAFDKGDSFVVKVGGVSGELQWMTYLGGHEYDYGYGIVADSSGNALVTGATYSTDFEGQTNTYYGTCDAFVVKVNATGTLQWMTYLGGATGWDFGYGIALEGTGNVIIAGTTNSTDFSGRNNAFHGDNSWEDAFVLKVTGTAGTIQWMTYLGGSDIDIGKGVAVDSAGISYVTGQTYSTDFEGRVNEYHGGGPNHGSDAFMVTVFASGVPQWMTYLGGGDTDAGEGIATDSEGNALVTGWTSSTDFEGNNNAYHGGLYDAFVVKVSLADNTAPQLTVDAACPDAGPIQVSWTGATPNGNAALIFAHHQGTFTVPQGLPCAGTQLGLGNQQIQIVWSGRSDANGAKTIHANVGTGVCGSFLQLLDLSDCQTSNVAVIQ